MAKKSKVSNTAENTEKEVENTNNTNNPVKNELKTLGVGYVTPFVIRENKNGDKLTFIYEFKRIQTGTKVDRYKTEITSDVLFLQYVVNYKNGSKGYVSSFKIGKDFNEQLIRDNSKVIRF